MSFWWCLISFECASERPPEQHFQLTKHIEIVAESFFLLRDLYGYSREGGGWNFYVAPFMLR